MHIRRHTTRLPSYRHKTFPTQIFRKLLGIVQAINGRFVSARDEVAIDSSYPKI